MAKHKERAKKQTSEDLIPKNVIREAENVVFSIPTASYEEQLRQVNKRVYAPDNVAQAINPRHTEMALNMARQAF